MITRLEYQSWDYTRTATILWLDTRRWHVVRRKHEGNSTQAHPWPITAVGECETKSLTKAQALARQWVSRGGASNWPGHGRRRRGARR